jgi:hypothetical protein
MRHGCGRRLCGQQMPEESQDYQPVMTTRKLRRVEEHRFLAGPLLGLQGAAAPASHRTAKSPNA